MFKVYRSSNPDSDGGSIGAEFNPRQDKLAVIEPIPFANSGAPSSCFAGQIYRKIFIKNDGLGSRTVVAKLSKQTKSGAVYLALGDQSDTTPPDDSAFISVLDGGGQMPVGDLLPGESFSIWVLIKWPDSAGLTVDASFTIDLLFGAAKETIELYYFLELYIETFTKGEENDYTSWLKDLFITFLRNVLYRSPKKEIRWHPDPSKTNIFIADRLTYNLEEPETRPSIVVIRGGLSWRDLVMDQLKSYDLIDRTRERTDFIQGNMVLQCVAREGLHAESIATMVFKVLKYYKDDLRAMGLHEIQRVSIGEELNIMGDTRPEAVMVPVNLGVVIQDSWLTWEEWPILRGMDFLVGDQKKTV